MRELLDPLSAGERDALEHTLDTLLAAAPVDVDTARHDCRLCEAAACDRCPITRAVTR
jgi:hypothetical protein